MSWRPQRELKVVTQILDEHLLLPFRGLGMDRSEQCDLAFRPDLRRIIRRKVLKPFVVPGVYWLTSTQKVQGVRRTAKPGSYVFIRQDLREGGLYDMEVAQRSVGEYCVFTLTTEEYGTLGQWLGPEEELCGTKSHKEGETDADHPRGAEPDSEVGDTEA